MTNSNENCADGDSVTSFITLVTTVIDDEVEKTVLLHPSSAEGTVPEKVKTMLYNIWKAPISRMFVPRDLSSMLDAISNDPDRMSFMLTVTDTIAVYTSTKGVSTSELIETIVKALSHNRPSAVYHSGVEYDGLCLIPKRIVDGIYTESSDIRKCLEDNFWLVVLFYYKLGFRNSRMFNSDLATLAANNMQKKKS